VKLRWSVLFAALALAPLSCGEPAKAPVKQDNSPAWADIWPSTPDILVVVHPQLLKGDRTYGALWKALVRAAQARGFARGATMVEALEGSSELLVGVNQNEASLVMRGVPASLDPTKIQSDDGKPFFKQVSNERAKVGEFTAADNRLSDGALFVLPDRTWVGAMGAARDRARNVFASPTHKPAPEAPAGALVSVRLGGQFLHVFERRRFAPLLKKLTSVTLSLNPGTGGLQIALAYSESDATAYGEMQAKKIAQEWAAEPLNENQRKERDWVKNAHIAYEGDVVYVHLTLPQRLIDELPNATGADLGL
jgi:hypothetical protein